MKRINQAAFIAAVWVALVMAAPRLAGAEGFAFAALVLALCFFWAALKKGRQVVISAAAEITLVVALGAWIADTMSGRAGGEFYAWAAAVTLVMAVFVAGGFLRLGSCSRLLEMDQKQKDKK